MTTTPETPRGSMKEATKHTPGPWTATFRYHKDGIPEGRVFGPDCVVAVVGGYSDPGLLPICRERWDADKRLIAAAPELLAALRDAPKPEGFDHTAPEFWFRKYEAWRERVRAVLHKVEQGEGS